MFTASLSVHKQISKLTKIIPRQKIRNKIIARESIVIRKRRMRGTVNIVRNVNERYFPGSRYWLFPDKSPAGKNAWEEKRDRKREREKIKTRASINLTGLNPRENNTRANVAAISAEFVIAPQILDE